MSILILWALIGGAFWFLVLRPQQQRVKAQRALVQSLEVGDEIVTVGGLLGVIVALEGDIVTVEPCSGVRLRFRRPAISARLGSPADDDIVVLDDDDRPGGDDMIR